MPQLSFSAGNLHWFFALVTPLAVSVLGTILAQPRARVEHYKVLAVNDWLAKHQLVYFAFYFSLLKGANLLGRNVILTDVVIFLAVVSLIFYGISVHTTAEQLERVRTLHGCAYACGESLPVLMWLRGFYLLPLLAILLFVVGVVTIFNPAFSA